ncbi:MAG: DUF177 domain-containing protein [Lachnospiraceae bacterium]|nr:DUF177 domain-containing protein [Lachnospiraceae bacterium]MBQ5561684.1 DUF177 domain-containing protein [Lachnospiraceae bacterium]
MLINLSEVMANVGQTKDTQASIEFQEFVMYGDSYPVVDKTDVHVVVQCVGERKVSIQCEAQVDLSIPCSRCLDEVNVPFKIDYLKKFDFSGTKEEEIEELEAAIYIRDYDLDVDTLIKEEMMLQFPLQTLCSDDCKGICDVCGTNLNKGTCDCDQQGRDPRMLAIQDIFKNFKQTD